MSAVLAAAGPNNKVIDYWCTHQVVNWAAVGHEVDSSLRVTFDRRLCQFITVSVHLYVQGGPKKLYIFQHTTSVVRPELY